jgi:hypothetical protein
MGNIFTQLLEEDTRQKEQLQASQPTFTKSQEVFPVQEVTPVEPERRNDIPTKRRSDGATLRHSDETTNRHSDIPTKRRITERTAFDLYQDQVQAIRRLRAERELSGEKKISLSDIAREAFALYLQQQGQ